MAGASVPNTFVADTEASADDVNANFAELVDFANNETMHRDGSKSFTGIPTLPASNPTSANQAVRKGYVDGLAVNMAKYGGILGSSMTTGPAPSGVFQPKIAGGRLSGTLDASGCLTIVFPSGCFPNGIMGLMVTPLGNIGANGTSVFNVRNITTSSCQVQFTQPDTAAPRIGMSCQVSWLGYGW